MLLRNMIDIPTRIAIGTQKAASTYLYNLLASHPDVSLSEITEVNFYSSNFDKGVNWYVSTFKHEGASIDISPKYFMSGNVVAPRITETLGETKPKLLLILRNPIDYVNSHFSMQQQQGFFERSDQYQNPPTTLVPFLAAYPKYQERGMYYKILTEQWLTHFAPEDIKIIFFEELVGKETKEQILRDIQTFWGLTPHTLTASTTSQNRALRSPFLHKLKNKVIKRPALKKYLKQQKWFHYFYKNVLTINSTQTLTSEDREYIKTLFIDDVEKLKTLLQRDVPWKDFT